VERAARRAAGGRAEALAAAQYRIVVAPGCHSEAYPPVVGWVCTRRAAVALSELMTDMPGGTFHNHLRFEVAS